MTHPALRLRSVTRSYGTGPGAVTALDAVTLDIPRGTFTAVMGPSGSGKSTLLQCTAGLDRPTAGRVLLGDTELTGLSERKLSRLRRTRIGFVFQAYNLLPALTAEQNVALPLRLAGRRPRRADVLDVLDRVGLRDRAGHRPGELSGGQQQRVALARALVTRPDVLFGDEPTGALDSASGRQVLALLRAMADDGQTVIMVTHDPVAASRADQVLFLADGRIRDTLTRPTAERIATHMTQMTAAPGRRGSRDAEVRRAVTVDAGPDARGSRGAGVRRATAARGSDACGVRDVEAGDAEPPSVTAASGPDARGARGVEAGDAEPPSVTDGSGPDARGARGAGVRSC